jgi:hypothetical protein
MIPREELDALRAELKHSVDRLAHMAILVKGSPKESVCRSMKRNIEDALFMLGSLKGDEKS